MRRMQKALMLAIFGSLVAGCATAQNDQWSGLYYQDGVNREDGMSADIDLEHRTFRIASDLFDLRPCRSRGAEYCLNSQYFLLAYDADMPQSWEVDGVEFSLDVKCNVKHSSGRTSQAALISSIRSMEDLAS